MIKNISTDVQNDDLDKDIEISEVEDALHKLNVKSKTSDSITPKCINNLFPTIIQMLLTFDLIFKDGIMHIHQDSRFISLQKQTNNMSLHVTKTCNNKKNS